MKALPATDRFRAGHKEQDVNEHGDECENENNIRFCLKMGKSAPRKYDVDNVINTNIHIIFDDSY